MRSKLRSRSYQIFEDLDRQLALGLELIGDERERSVQMRADFGFRSLSRRYDHAGNRALVIVDDLHFLRIRDQRSVLVGMTSLGAIPTMSPIMHVWAAAQWSRPKRPVPRPGDDSNAAQSAHGASE